VAKESSRTGALLGPSAIGNRAPAIYVAPPRIFKMGEDWILKQVRSGEADGYLVRNYDHLKFFADCRCIGDFSLNISNQHAAEYYKTRLGLERITASYDLNMTQLEALLQSAPPNWFEITIHQHMPMFHMEHCVFAPFCPRELISPIADVLTTNMTWSFATVSERSIRSKPMPAAGTQSSMPWPKPERNPWRGC
jgi:hypothetical protein